MLSLSVRCPSDDFRGENQVRSGKDGIPRRSSKDGILLIMAIFLCHTICLYQLFRDHQDHLDSKATGSTSSAPGETKTTQQRPKDRSLPPPRTSTAAAPWLSHQFCRLQIQKKSSVRQIDVSTGSNGDWDVSMELKNAPAAPSDNFTNSKNLGPKNSAGLSGFLEMWTSSGKS
ncbi:unnamed protein product [Caenorhabditis nigoni]